MSNGIKPQIRNENDECWSSFCSNFYPVDRFDNINVLGDMRDKYNKLATQLQQLKDHTNAEFCKVSKRINNSFTDQNNRIKLLHDSKIDQIHNQFKLDSSTCDDECLHEKKRIQDYLITLCEDLKLRLEHDQSKIELTASGDVLEVRPAMTRKLRRRAPDTPSSIGNPAFCVAGNKFTFWSDTHLFGINLFSSSKLNAEDPNNSLGALDESVANLVTSSPTSLFGSLSVDLSDGNSLLTNLIFSLSAAGNGQGDSGSNAITQTSLASTLVCFGGAGPNPSSVTSVAAAIVPGLTTPNTPPPSKRVKKQNHQPSCQLSLLLAENEINDDVQKIRSYSFGRGGKPSQSSNLHRKYTQEGRGMGPGSPRSSRGDETHNRRRGDAAESGRRDELTQDRHPHHCLSENGSSMGHICIDDGALFIGSTIYRQGSHVFIETLGCSGTVATVGAADITIKRNSDTGLVRISVQQLKQGRYVLAPAKNR